jgi:hypothetical protein
MTKEITGKINHAGIITRNNFPVFRLSKYNAGATTESTVD